MADQLTQNTMVTLTKAEEKIMMILWSIKKGFINDIIDEMSDPKPPYNSVSTIVRVLVKKEIVGFKKYGTAYQYYPLIPKDDYRKGQLGRLIKDYYNNSFKQVVSFFSDDRGIKAEEVDEVIKMLEELKNKKDD